LNAPFDENQRTLLQIFLGDLRLFAPHDDLVPLGALLAFAVAVFVSLIRGDGKIGNRLTATCEPRLRIAPEAPN
jgi:hypothetical protein